MIYLTPHAELFSILGYPIQTWGVIAVIGIFLSLFLMLKKAAKKKMFDDAENLIALIMVAAVIGARLAYIIVNPSEFSNFWELFEIWNGGVISWGFLLGGMIGAIAFKLFAGMKNERLKELLDLMVPYFILAIAIGRIGCFLRGCCFGIPSELPWAVNYIGENALSKGAVHPTPIYHSILDFIIFFILMKINRKKEILEKKGIESKFRFFNRKGSVFLLFLILYSAERFFVDFLRWHPASEYIGAISTTQFIFLLIFSAALFLLFMKKIKRRKLK